MLECYRKWRYLQQGHAVGNRTEIAMTVVAIKRQSMTLDDFFTGLVAGLAARGVRVVSIRGEQFHKAMEDVYRTANREAREEGVKLKFAITRNELHGDSPDVREALAKGVQRDIVSLDNPEYQNMRLKISKSFAPDYFRRLPGREEMYLKMADTFLAEYPAFQ